MARRTEPIANGDHEAVIDRVLWLIAQPSLPVDAAVGPSFQFYPKDWLADSKVVKMSRVAAAIHMQSMCLAWSEHPPCSLPAESDDLEDLFEGVSASDQRAVLRAWVIRDGRMWQPGLCKSYLSQIWNRLKRAEGGLTKAKNDKGLESVRALQSALLSTCSEGFEKEKSEKNACSTPAKSYIASSPLSPSPATSTKTTSPPSVLPKKGEDLLLLAPDPSASGSAALTKASPGELFELTPEATGPDDPVEFWFPLAGGEPPRNAPHGPWRTAADGSFEYGVRTSEVRRLARLYPGVDVGGEKGVRLELARCQAWNVDNPSRRKTYPKGKGSGVTEHIKSWLADKHGKGGPRVTNGNGAPNGAPGKYGKTDAMRFAERGAMGRSQALVDKAARFQEIAAEERRRQEEARARS